MSGESVWVFFKKPKDSLMELRLAVESDQRLYTSMGTGFVLGIGLISYLLTLQILIPDRLQVSCAWDDGADGGSPGLVKLPPDFYSSLPKKRVKHMPLKTAQEASVAKTKKPIQTPGFLLQKLITSKTNRTNFSAYEVLGEVMKSLDMDKISQAASLSRTDPTRLSGRRGKQSAEFNLGYYEGGTGSGSGSEFALPKPSFSVLPPKDMGNRVRGTITSVESIEGEAARSTSAILGVIRAHAPGLRHIYNTYLRTNPGMQGKVTLRFAIAPSGHVVDIALVASSTGIADFDREVMNKAISWRFDAVKSLGNDIVTVPVNFSE